MYYAIFTSDGNLVESFDEESEARVALEAIANEDPDTADEYALLAYGDDGMPEGDALSAADLIAHA